MYIYFYINSHQHEKAGCFKVCATEPCLPDGRRDDTKELLVQLFSLVTLIQTHLFQGMSFLSACSLK